MKSWTYINVLLLLNICVALTTALPYRHLVTFEPELSYGPQETVVATQLHVSPRADGTGDYLLKEVPLISRNLNKEIIAIEEKLNTEEKMPQNVESVTEITMPAVVAVTEGTEGEEALKATGDSDELVKNNESIDQSSKSVDSVVMKPQKHKYSDTDDGNPIYITIPIYVNSKPGLPLTLSVGSQEIQLTSNRKGITGRRGSLQREQSPTSLYNKLLKK